MAMSNETGSYLQVPVAVLADTGFHFQVPVAVLGLTFRCLWQC